MFIDKLKYTYYIIYIIYIYIYMRLNPTYYELKVLEQDIPMGRGYQAYQ